MQEIIKISENTIGDSSVHSVSARDLHRELGVKKDFTNWIKYQLAKGFFIEGEDYVCIRQKRRTQTKSGRNGISVTTEYFLTLDTAKEIAMMSRTEKGKMIRNYFIEVEKTFSRQMIQPKNQSDLISVSTENMRKEIELLEFAFENLEMSKNEKRLFANKVFDKLNFPTLETQPKRKIEPVFTLTQLLEDFQISFSPHEINLKLQSYGILQKVGGYWFLKNLNFGVNESYENHTNPKYYKSTFQELLDIFL